jgi:RNA polymerase sigma factor (sigma-70 family)
MAHSTEREIYLVQGSLANDRKAQYELFMSYKDAMYTIVYRLTGNAQDAEDILQEGFIKVFQNLKSFKGESTVGAWMKTIFVRTALEKLRKTIHFLDIEEAHGKQHSFDDGLTGELLEKAILDLDNGYRTVFLLVEVEGYQHKEVASMLGISEGTSKSQLARAKKKLQGKIRKLIDFE